MAKLPDLGLPFFYRVVIPGALLVLVAGPVLVRLFAFAGIVDSTAQTTAAAVLAALVGFALSALDDPIYEFYEGRRWWPARLGSWATKRLARHIAKRLRAADHAKDADYDELWSELRQYPLDVEGKP